MKVGVQESVLGGSSIIQSRGNFTAIDSNLGYLKKLPVDFLKIDGMFVKDIVADPTSAAIVKSIHEIGQVMGKQTIAEFVEDEFILEKLREIGVHYAQGYFVGQPQCLKDKVHQE